ncbi:hypothetical protein GGR54DRAFT_401870 [Hypoxylon sp. NC1633]|nr:hypothetical protein GGR54DRAFT_401870 [Hypoxylon sp. NC1633]
MAPNLKTFKSFSSRLGRIRRHRKGQDSLGGGDDEEQLPLPQIPEHATLPGTTSRSTTGPAQPKKASGSSHNLTSAMPTSQESHLPLSESELMAMPPGAYNFPVANAPAGNPLWSQSAGTSLMSNNQAGSQSYGVQPNPIDLTAGPFSNNAVWPPPFHVGPTYSQGPNMAHGIVPQQPQSSSSYTFNKPGFPPEYSGTASSQKKKTQPGPSWHQANPTPAGFGAPQFPTSGPPMPELWNSQGPSVPPFQTPIPQWFGQVPVPFNQFLGYVNEHNKLEDGSIGGPPWAWSDGGLPLPYPAPHPHQVPATNTASMDINSSEDSSDGSAESGPHVKAALESLEPLQLFVHKCIHHNCSACSRGVSMGPKDVVKMTTGWTKNMSGSILLGATCQGMLCQVTRCLGCGSPFHPRGADDSNTAFLYVSGVKWIVRWCCDLGRLAAIWAIACGWEVPTSKSRAVSCVVNKVRERTSGKSVAMQSAPPPQHPSANAKGVGYGSGHQDYFHFHYFPPRMRLQPNVIPKKPIDTRDDVMHETYFRLLALLLPSSERNSLLDASPPDYLSHMLSRSPLVQQAATMLSNDSIEEVCRQYLLHDAVLDLFDALGNHPSTAGLVYDERNLYHAKGGSLLDVSFMVGGCKSKGRLAVKDTGKPLIALLDKLAAQSQTILRHARGHDAEFSSREGRNLLLLSQRLSSISAQHNANKQRLQTTMDICVDQPDINFSEWHHDHCVEDVSDEVIIRGFVFEQDVGRTANCIPTRGRMKRLITELSTLRTSLPEGIFIRHGSSRLDVMKVMIIGPRHTPYEYGVFEFDLFCPLDYPASPPKMKFMTTNGGRTRFNPNLYEDGKICLSLLGTWAGEPWRADQSTLLQLLVSIQAMILCAEPWYNEPGREEAESKAQSAKYNNDVRSWTLLFALLPWINATSATAEGQEPTTNTAAAATANLAPFWQDPVTPCWQETVRLHLLANARDILTSSKQASSKSKKTILQNAVDNVETCLRSQGYLN